MNQINILDLILGIAALFTIVGVIFTIKAFYKREPKQKQSAIGRHIYQAGGDIKIGKDKYD